MTRQQAAMKETILEMATGSLFDVNDPKSLVNVVPERLIPVLHRIRGQMPKLMLSEERVMRLKCQPDERADRLRLQFWDEYNFATLHGKKMQLGHIYAGVTNWETWCRLVEPNTKWMLWIVTPPKSYASQMKYILQQGLNRLQEIVNLPIIKPNGETDTKTAALILKVITLVDARVMGAIPQSLNIRQQNLNLNAEISRDEAQQAIAEMSVEQLEELDKKLDRAKRVGQKMLEVLPEEERRALEELPTIEHE